MQTCLALGCGIGLEISKQIGKLFEGGRKAQLARAEFESLFEEMGNGSTDASFIIRCRSSWHDKNRKNWEKITFANLCPCQGTQ